MGVDQPKGSHLLHGRLAGFSTDRLPTWLTALGQDVDILVRMSPGRRQERLRVRMLAARPLTHAPHPRESAPRGFGARITIKN